MNMHKNARLTPSGRALLAERIEMGWRADAAAEAAGVSVRTARKWLKRHRLGAGHADRSSAPRHCPHRTPERRIAEIERLRRERMTGPRIARTLGMARSTVGAVLRRLGLGRLSSLDPKPPIVRYERDRPGEMIHLEPKVGAEQPHQEAGPDQRRGPSLHRERTRNAQPRPGLGLPARLRR